MSFCEQIKINNIGAFLAFQISWLYVYLPLTNAMKAFDIFRIPIHHESDVENFKFTRR